MILVILSFVLGQAIHLLFVKIPKLKKRGRSASKKFVFIEWWNEDWNIIIGTQLVGALLLMVSHELATITSTDDGQKIFPWIPDIEKYPLITFALAGAFGSQVAMAYLSRYEKQYEQLVDIKTNASDILTGAGNDKEKIIEVVKEITGQDASPPKKCAATKYGALLLGLEVMEL